MSKSKDKSIPWWKRGYGSGWGGWGGWRSADDGDDFATPSYYSTPSFYYPTWKSKEFFSDKQDKFPTKGKFEEYEEITNKYRIPNVSDKFAGCLFWIKDINTNDQDIMEQFGRQSCNLSKAISGMAPKITLDQNGSHVSYDGATMQLDISAMFDYRLEKDMRINIFFSNLLHEVGHLAFTIPVVGEMLKAMGTTKHEMSRDGKLIHVPDYENGDIFQGNSLLANIFNINEDYRIEKLLLRTREGYVGYFDQSLQYYSWLHSNYEYGKVSKVSSACLLYITVKMLFDEITYKQMMGKSNITSLLHDADAKIPLIDHLITRAKDSETFQETMAVSREMEKILREIAKDNGEQIGKGKKGKGTGASTECIGEGGFEFDISTLPGDIPTAGDGTTIKLPKPNKSMEDLPRDMKDKFRSIEEALGDGTHKGETEGKDGKDKLIPPGGSKDKAKCKDINVNVRIDLEKKFGSIGHPKLNNEIVTRGTFDISIYNIAKNLAKSFNKNLAFLKSKLTGIQESYEFDSGDLDEDEVYTFKSKGKFNRHIFTDDEPEREFSLDIMLLIDQSGSMDGIRERKAKEVGLGCFLAFVDYPNINVYLYGHNSHHGVTLYEYYNPNRPGSDVSSLFNMNTGSANYDGFAILEACEILKKGKGASKIMIVISDGQPNEEDYKAQAAVKHTAESVKIVERAGIFIVQVAIANIDNSSKMFTHYLPYDGKTTLGQGISKILEKEYNKIAHKA